MTKIRSSASVKNTTLGSLRQSDSSTASMSKYWISDLQCKIIDECLQLHGGWGYMDEYPIGQMYQDARVQRIYGGANEVMKMLIARTL